MKRDISALRPERELDAFIEHFHLFIQLFSSDYNAYEWSCKVAAVAKCCCTENSHEADDSFKKPLQSSANIE